jgi:hypothetical protein
MLSSLLLGLAALARFYPILSAPLRSSEVLVWAAASQANPIHFFMICLRSGISPLACSPVWLLARFSDALWVLRLPAALEGLACVWLLLRLLKRRLKEFQALLVAALAALSPLSLVLAWDAGPGNFSALMSLLMLDEAMQVLDEPGRGWRRLALWAGATTASLGGGPLLVLALLAGACWAEGSATPRLRELLKGAWSGILAALPFSPFLYRWMLPAMATAGGSLPSYAPLFSLEACSGGYWMEPGPQVGALAVFLIAVLGLSIKREESDSERRIFKMLAALALFPLLLWFPLFSRVLGGDGEAALGAGAVAWAALAGLGALRLQGWFRPAMFVALFATQALALADFQMHPESQPVDYSPAWQEISGQWQEGDLVIHAYAESGLPFEYYASREAEEAGSPSPKPTYILGRAGAIQDPAFVSGQRLADLSAGAKRLWVLVASDQAVRRQRESVRGGLFEAAPLAGAFNFAAQDWMLGKWRFEAQEGSADVPVYLYQRAP